MCVRRTRVCSSVCASVCVSVCGVCVDASLCMPGRAGPRCIHVDCVSSCKPSICHSIHLHIFTLPRLAMSRPVSSRLISSRLTHPHQSVASNPYLLLLIARQLPVAILPITFFGLVSLKQPLTASERIEQPQPAPGSCLDGISIWMWILACMLCLSTQ